MQLLQHFKELTIRPKNAKELKGLILQLAIQGKLTANWRTENPNIKSTAELLEELIIEKKLLIKEKKIKNEKSLPKLNKEELIINLPSSWETVRLGEIGDWGAGSTPLRSNSSFYGGEINWFKSGELNNSIIDYESKEKITQLALEKTSVRLNNPGDVLIAMYGATIGKTGVLNVVGTTNQAVCACTPFSCITSSFLHLLLKGLKNTFINQGEGGAQPNISRVKIRNQVFGLPPLEEQNEIVNVVETLFKEVEQLEQLTVKRIGLKEDFVTSVLNQLTTSNANQEWTFLKDHFKSFFNEPTNIKKLRETVLQLAVQGKLTADWRSRHPELVEGSHHASQLLKRIQEEKAQLIADKKIKKEKALPPITKEEIPYELPKGWIWCRFGDLITFLNGYAFKSSTYVPLSEYQIIRLGNVKSDNFLINTKEAYVPESIGEETLAYQLYKDDILTTLTGTKDKRDYCYTCLVKDAHLEDKILLLNQRVGCIRAIDKSSSELLNKFLKSEIILNQLFETETGTANQGNIGSTSFKNLVFPLPPLQEQKVIVKKVNTLMGLCDALEQEVQQSQEYSEQLMQSVLREVFEDEKI